MWAVASAYELCDLLFLASRAIISLLIHQVDFWDFCSGRSCAFPLQLLVLAHGSHRRKTQLSVPIRAAVCLGDPLGAGVANLVISKLKPNHTLDHPRKSSGR